MENAKPRKKIMLDLDELYDPAREAAATSVTLANTTFNDEDNALIERFAEGIEADPVLPGRNPTEPVAPAPTTLLIFLLGFLTSLLDCLHQIGSGNRPG